MVSAAPLPLNEQPVRSPTAPSIASLSSAEAPRRSVVAGAHERDVVAIAAVEEVVALAADEMSAPRPPSSTSPITPAGSVEASTTSAPPSALDPQRSRSSGSAVATVVLTGRLPTFAAELSWVDVDDVGGRRAVDDHVVRLAVGAVRPWPSCSSAPSVSGTCTESAPPPGAKLAFSTAGHVDRPSAGRAIVAHGSTPPRAQASGEQASASAEIAAMDLRALSRCRLSPPSTTSDPSPDVQRRSVIAGTPGERVGVRARREA